MKFHVRLVRRTVLFASWDDAERFAESVAFRNLGRVVKYGENGDIRDCEFKVVNRTKSSADVLLGR